jgi:hypothetical protein
MIRAGCLEKLLEVVRGLLHLTFKITLDGSNMLLVGVTSILIVITFITTGGDCDSLGLPLWPPLVISSAPLCNPFSHFSWHPPLLPGAAFSLFCMKTTLTASTPEAYLVMMSRNSFMVFGWSCLNLCTRVQ